MQGRTLYQICTQEKTELVQVWIWIRDLAHQLELYYKRQNGQAYGYVNPYAVILTKDGKVTLIDPGDKGNAALLKKMQQKKYRMHFVPPEQSLSQIKSRENDLYAFGKTIQFLIARMNLGKKLSKKEEKLLQKIIQGCVQGRYKDEDGLREIQHLLRNITPEQAKKRKPEEKRKGRGKAAGMVLVLAVLLAAAGAMVFFQRIPNAFAGKKGEIHRIEESEEEQREGVSGDTGEETVSLDEDSFWPIELGLIYLYGMGDTESALSLLESASGESATGAFYYKLIRSLYHSEGTVSEVELDEQFQGLAELGNQEWLEGKEYWLCIPFIEGYSRFDSDASWEKIQDTSRWIMERKAWPKGENEAKYESELCQYYSAALERKEKYEEAAKELLRILELKQEKAGREDVYGKLMELYRKEENTEKLWKTGEAAVEEFPGSEILWILYARSYLEQVSLSEDRRCAAATKAIQMIPELKDNEQFQQILTENGASMKGDRVCISE